ncbi:PAS domain-containing sensor histidine kinase [Kineosporia succinea]|uniref:histidine kinase n=1 Tax=Kineosporia succinea TaxID=84632 RepID=A0ABT9NYM3_9ACTN|nr:PAS domain S-box protein [Kineosporia succinea]MDP9825090.1 PAS domain S-box-containing protein [Kineosporia succinea]
MADLLRCVLDGLEGRICVLGPAGEVLDANRAWDQLVTEAGWCVPPGGRGDVFGLAEQMPEELTVPLTRAVRDLLGGREAQEIKGSLLVRGRLERVVVRLRAVPGHEQVAGLVTVVDITGPANSQLEQRRTFDEAQMLALVARHTDNAVLIMDVAGRIEWVNEAFCRMSGYTFEEACGLVRADLMVRPFVRSAGFAMFEKALREERGADLQVPMQSKEGRTYWVQMELQPIVEGNVMAGRFVCIERDVTAQRNAEEQLRAATRQARLLAAELHAEKTLLGEVLGAIPHVVYWKDSEQRYAGLNPAFLTLRGLSEQDVLERTERELPRADDLTDVLVEAETAVLLSGAPRENQRVVVNPSGQGWRTLLLNVLPQTDAAGVVNGVIGVAADVTQLSALEQHLAQASRLESIGQLAAGIAHEINTPVQYVTDNTQFLVGVFDELMTACTTSGEALRAGDTDRAQQALDAVDLDFLAEEIPAALSQSQEGLGRVAQIVGAMKDFSHPGQGRGDADLNRAVRSTVQVCRNEWRYVAEVELSLSDRVGMVACYEGELKQVLLNVLVNAAQAIGEQRAAGRETLGRIRVSTRRRAQGVRITITDDGPGMPEDVRRRVFDPFFTTKPVGKGTGQGLSMAYAVVVQKHAGALDVRSRPGAGATFVLDLPDPRPGEPVDDDQDGP